MTPEQMQKRSGEKVKQVLDLMKLLNINTEVRTKMDKGGFIEDVVFWIDNEEYPAAEPVAPTGETGSNA